MGTWTPITLDRLAKIIEADLRDCDEGLRSLFAKYAVAPYHAPIDRHGHEELVFVVAKKANEVMYYEDIEDGFNISPVTEHGKIAEHWVEQNPLKWALKPWRCGR
jgi:hypothetical protein